VDGKDGTPHWYDHVECNDKSDWVSYQHAGNYRFEGIKTKGRGRKTWNECV